MHRLENAFCAKERWNAFFVSCTWILDPSTTWKHGMAPSAGSGASSRAFNTKAVERLAIHARADAGSSSPGRFARTTSDTSLRI